MKDIKQRKLIALKSALLRIIIALSVISLTITFAVGCESKSKKANQSKDALASSQTSENDIEYNTALRLINEGKYEEAYNLLSEIKSNDKASLLLDNFKILHTKITTGNGSSAQISYNNIGLPIKEEWANGYTIETSYYSNGIVKSI